MDGVAVTVTGTVQRQAWREAVLPPVERVQDGLWSVPVPIPNNPLRYVLVHLLELHDGVALIDTGWNTEDAWAALVAGLGTAGFGVGDVRTALITHIHPDHYGLAGRLREASGARIALHPADAALIPARYGAGVGQLVTEMRTFLRRCGVPAEVVAELSEASMGVREFVAQAEPDILLQSHTRLELPGWNLVPLHTPGHSPGHCVFLERDRRLLFSGDHVLPRISPNISVHAQQPGNPLADFLDSLARVRALEVDEVLPAHEWRFAPLAARVDQLVAHHGRRLDLVAAAVDAAPRATCWEIAATLPWSRAWSDIHGHMRRAAVGETLAHLVLLQARGRVVREPGEPWRWTAPHGS
ncbi:MAG: MBL fold metallo-hydrolase [Candidatus Dormibacteria bacterium]